MNIFEPDRKAFEAAPLEYSAIAWQKWEMAQSIATGKDSHSKSPSGIGLKDPLLWLTQAHALSEASRVVLLKVPEWKSMPELVRGACDSQYCAAGLMLVGYSLEVSLKAMLILRHGVDAYTEEERKYQHHKLERLGEFLPNLDAKDKAILRALTHYIEWTGRYPDPGGGRDSKLEEIFALSEKHRICAHDLFNLAGRVMKYANTVIEDYISKNEA